MLPWPINNTSGNIFSSYNNSSNQHHQLSSEHQNSTGQVQHGTSASATMASITASASTPTTAAAPSSTSCLQNLMGQVQHSQQPELPSASYALFIGLSPPASPCVCTRNLGGAAKLPVQFYDQKKIVCTLGHKKG